MNIPLISITMIYTKEEFTIFIGCIMEYNPKIKRILKTQEPIAFPIAISFFSCFLKQIMELSLRSSRLRCKY